MCRKLHARTEFFIQRKPNEEKSAADIWWRQNVPTCVQGQFLMTYPLPSTPECTSHWWVHDINWQWFWRFRIIYACLHCDHTLRQTSSSMPPKSPATNPFFVCVGFHGNEWVKEYYATFSIRNTSAMLYECCVRILHVGLSTVVSVLDWKIAYTWPGGERNILSFQVVAKCGNL